VNVSEHALPGCIAQDDVEGVDLVTVVIAWYKRHGQEGDGEVKRELVRNAINCGSVKEERTNAKRPCMHTESAREMARRTLIKPAGSCSS
jgi:hypothetical protein